MHKEKSRTILISLFVLIAFLMPAQAQAESEDSGLKSSTTLELQTSTLPEAKLRINQNFVFPILRGSGPLTEGNNLQANIKADITPISLTGIGEATLTPIAFLMLHGGALAGSGWNMSLGNGIGVKSPIGGTPPKSEVDGKAFDGLQWGAWGAGTFQFDLAAIFPGDWTHVVFQVRQEFRYSAYTKAGADDYWYFESDDGENKNGWRYLPTYTVGYQMPLSPVLNFVGFMAEMNKPLYPSTNEPWGDALNLGKWVFSGLFNFQFTPSVSAIMAVQMRTRRNHGFSDFNNKEYFYPEIPLKPDEDQRRVLFYRVALNLSYKIR